MFLHYRINFCLHSLDLALQFSQFLHVVRVLIDIILWSWLIRPHRRLTFILIAYVARIPQIDRCSRSTHVRITSRHIGQCAFQQIDLKYRLLHISLVLALCLPELAELEVLAALQVRWRRLHHELMLDHVPDRFHLYNLELNVDSYRPARRNDSLDWFDNEEARRRRLDLVGRVLVLQVVRDLEHGLRELPVIRLVENE